jgi:hypothetical protein
MEKRQVELFDTDEGQSAPLSARPPLLRHHHLPHLDGKMFTSIIATDETVSGNDLLFTIVC